jgi:glycosyltransferase involved in cell wall biosynthesis
VAHLDHTTVSGGAEIALLRMLQARPTWLPAVLLPPTESAGVFADLPPRVPLTVRGVRQLAGVSAESAGFLVAAAVRLSAQALVTRLDPHFRTADVVDANTARAAAYGALAACSSRVRFVVHLRDIVTPEALGRFGYEIMTRVALRRADGVVANSRATLESARPFLRAHTQVAVIPSASGLRPGAPRPPRAQGPLRIGMLARIDPWKGQRQLLEAFAAAETGDAVLEFAGSPLFGHESFERELRELARELGVAGRVRFLGQVDEVATLLQGWDIAVQASQRAEPLGQNVLQYLAAGCAVIVAGEGGPAEWVKDDGNGLVVAPRDAAALEAALTRLAADADLRARLGGAAASTPGLLDDAGVAGEHARFYERVLGS